MVYRNGIGQDSHRFLPEKGEKTCIVGGVSFDEVPGMDADSDGDVALHAICNAITSITHVPILGKVAIKMCKEGITDSRFYLEEALKTLGAQYVVHVALAIEGKRPKFQKKADAIRENIAKLMKLDMSQVGITFTSGDDTLSEFAKGHGLQCFCTLTTCED